MKKAKKVKVDPVKMRVLEKTDAEFKEIQTAVNLITECFELNKVSHQSGLAAMMNLTIRIAQDNDVKTSTIILAFIEMDRQINDGAAQVEEVSGVGK